MTLDYDLAACLEYNTIGVLPDDIQAVLAVWEGENDGDDWRWVLAMHDGRFAFIQGGCDYTGWDCQSWATVVYRDSAEEAAIGAIGAVPVGALAEPQGLGHMLSMLTGEYMSNAKEVYESLSKQLVEGRNKTWRESKDEELGVVSGDVSKENES